MHGQVSTPILHGGLWAHGSLTGDFLVGESQDPQGLQCLLEELTLLARRG